MTPGNGPSRRANTTTREATPRTTIQRGQNPASHDLEPAPTDGKPRRALTGREKLLRGVTEKQFQRQVQGFLNAYGWRWFHAPDNRPVNGRVQAVKAGFPDLVAVRGGRLLFVELKRETGKTTQDQDDWLGDLATTGAECYVWRPRDLDEIRTTLAHLPASRD